MKTIKIKSNKKKLSDPIYMDVIYRAGVRATRTKTKREAENSNWNKYKKELRSY